MTKYHPTRFVSTFRDPKGRFQSLLRSIHLLHDLSRRPTEAEMEQWVVDMRGLAPAGRLDMTVSEGIDLAKGVLAIDELIADFERAGSQIFDFARIAPLFVHTEVDDVEMSMVQLPYPVCYLHFGRGADLLLPQDDPVCAGLYLEGCYLSQAPGSGLRNAEPIRMTVVCGYDGPDPETGGDENRIGSMTAEIVLDPVGTVAESLRRRHPTGNERFLRSGDLMTDALRMTVNGLLYLNSAAPDVVTSWSEGAPSDLVARASRPNKGDAAKWAARLTARGYVRVNVCGTRLAPNEWKEPGEGAGVAIHWRRGHWRAQRHGEGRALVRTTWIMPTLVNRHLGMPETGHVYDVQPL